MLRFEFWLCDGRQMPKALTRLEDNFRQAKLDAKEILAEHPELRKIDLICGDRHVGSVGACWASCSCGDLSTCGDSCPNYTHHQSAD